jgi:hypothetical protein
MNTISTIIFTDRAGPNGSHETGDRQATMHGRAREDGGTPVPAHAP